MSTLIENRDLKEAKELALELLDDPGNEVEELVSDVVLANSGRNSDAKEFMKYFETAITYIELVSLSKHDRSIFEDNRDLEAGVSKALEFACAAFAISDKNISDDLHDDDYGDCEDKAEALEKMEESIEDALDKQERRGSRGRDRDRGSRGRDDRRGSSRRSKRSSRRDGKRSNTSSGYRNNRRDEDEEEERRPRKTSKRRNERKSEREVKKAKYGRRDKDNGGEEFTEEDMDMGMDLNIPAIIAASKSRQRVNSLPGDPSTAFTPTTHGKYAISKDGEVYGAVLEHEEHDVEYKDHELRRSLVGTDRTGGRIVPLADFRTIKDPSSTVIEGEGEDAHPVPSIMFGEEIACVVDTPRIPTYVLTPMLDNDAEYQVSRLTRYMPLQLAKAVQLTTSGDIGELPAMRRFNDMYNWLTKAQEHCEDLPRKERFATTNSLELMAATLTRLGNNLFSIVSDIPGMDSFINDWPDAQAWLVSQGNADIYSAWQELEVEFLRHNFAALDSETAKHVVDTVPNATGTTFGDVNTVWVRSNAFAVLVDGDISAQVQISDPKIPARINVELTPDFYNACSMLVKHRNSELSMADIILIDSVGCQYTVLANKTAVPVMKVRTL